MKREIVRIEDIADLKLLREGWRNATRGEKYWRKSTRNYEVNLERNLLSLSTVFSTAHGDRRVVTHFA